MVVLLYLLLMTAAMMSMCLHECITHKQTEVITLAGKQGR